ncbi:LEA type 2 family protein [Longimicrobium sp.]|uniref:LEA type 2 family protein n=1 Tax=Longimicrobium sp. TaxID=2029185 RepID=UPI002E357FC7|nr:LEA type 2 family protein [Longimicrobium sp.]HEX6039733.1 LEA type 2 family protein [Longimicrobium sp.]
MLKRWTTLPVLALLVLSQACTGFRRPTIEMEGVELGSVGLTGGTLLVNLRVENPNAIGFRAEDLKYDLFLRQPGQNAASEDGWERLTGGTYEEDIVIRARETKTVQIPVNFRLTDLGPAASSVLRTGRFDYRVTGTVNVRAAGTRREVPFRKTGSMSLTGGLGR